LMNSRRLIVAPDVRGNYPIGPKRCLEGAAEIFSKTPECPAPARHSGQGE